MQFAARYCTVENLEIDVQNVRFSSISCERQVYGLSFSQASGEGSIPFTRLCDASSGSSPDEAFSVAQQGMDGLVVSGIGNRPGVSLLKSGDSITGR